MNGDERQWFGAKKIKAKKAYTTMDGLLRKGNADDARRDYLGIDGSATLAALSRTIAGIFRPPCLLKLLTSPQGHIQLAEQAGGFYSVPTALLAVGVHRRLRVPHTGHGSGSTERH